MDYQQLSLQSRQNGSPFCTGSTVTITHKNDLSVYYSPGIAAPCQKIAADKSLAKTLTVKRNMIAVVSDGSAVLGLGNIGPEAALPVMEGKCMLFKQFGNVDAVPIVLNTQDTEEIIQTIKHLAPTFGGINLEDIAAPRCFEIQQRLEQELDIPVFHDDQDGTAIVTLAAIMNALKVVGKKKSNLKICISGAGAAGLAIAKLLRAWGIPDIIIVDSSGIISCDRTDINDSKRLYCAKNGGNLAMAVQAADVFIGVSKAGLLTPAMIQTMAPDPIILAMANPTPEILPELAQQAGAAIVGTGRSDYPNQVNNVLVFPGFFRGLLDGGFTHLDKNMNLAAAEAIANLVAHPSAECIIPDPFNPAVAMSVADAVKNAV